MGTNLVSQGKGILLAISPIAIFFFLYDLLFLKQKAKQRVKILIGLLYSVLGLWFFLSAVSTGFLPVAQKLGYGLGSKSSLFPWAVLLGGLFGLFGVYAEPAVHVLGKQIEAVSEGAIKSKQILFIMVVAVRSSNLLGFLIAKAFDALLGLEVEFDPNPFSFFVN